MAPYLDAATAAPLHPLAREALAAALADGWADPDRLYREGRRARLLLEAARETLAEGIGVRPDELWLMPSGVHARQAAVLGGLAGNHRRGPVFVHSAVEHSAILHAAQWHAARGGTVRSVRVDRVGRVEVDEFVAAARDAALAALQSANHEVGTTQPVDEVAGRIATPLVVDATPTLGHAALPSGWDLLTADARTWGGPPGIGVLAIRAAAPWRSPWPAGEPPVDLPAAVAAAVALRAVLAEREAQAARLDALVDRIRTEVPALIPDVEVLGDPVGRLPHIVTFSCLYVDGEAVLSGLDRAGFAVSSGSSCTADTVEPSHVLVAMGALTSGNIRVSLSRDTTEQDIADFLAVLPRVVAGVRAELGAAGL